jgi:hypothetical protein
MIPSPAFIKSIHQLHAEAAGVIEAVVIRPSDTEGLFADIIAGDPEAHRLGAAINAALSRVNEWPKRQRLLCATCQKRVQGDGFAFVVVSALRDDAARSLTLAICTGCAIEPEDIKARANVALRVIWPDHRPMVVTHPGGGRA